MVNCSQISWVQILSGSTLSNLVTWGKFSTLSAPHFVFSKMEMTAASASHGVWCRENEQDNEWRAWHVMVNSFYDYIFFFLSVCYLTRASFFMLRVKTCQRKINLNTVSGQQPSYLRSHLPSASLFIRGFHLRRLAFPHVSACAITDCNIQRQDWHFLGNLYRQIHPKLKRACLSFAYHGLDAAVWEMRYGLGELPCSDPQLCHQLCGLGQVVSAPWLPVSSCVH